MIPTAQPQLAPAQPSTDPQAPEAADSSPEVFISYQWGKQRQVKRLYQALTATGYTCWLDIHQMGGGDSLYDKIDKGIRRCRVFITCVTSKYALSANCRREVSLADALKKPIIPLLLEETAWPPHGPMSLVFTHLLYINCHDDTHLQESWSQALPPMKQLCEQLANHVPRMKPADTIEIPVCESDDKPVTAAPSDTGNTPTTNGGDTGSTSARQTPTNTGSDTRSTSDGQTPTNTGIDTGNASARETPTSTGSDTANTSARQTPNDTSQESPQTLAQPAKSSSCVIL